MLILARNIFLDFALFFYYIIGIKILTRAKSGPNRIFSFIDINFNFKSRVAGTREGLDAFLLGHLINSAFLFYHKSNKEVVMRTLLKIVKHFLSVVVFKLLIMLHDIRIKFIKRSR